MVEVLPRAAPKTSTLRQPGHLHQPKVLWIHLHSYGGTTMCDLARAHGEKVSPRQDNCNLMPDGCSTVAALRIGCRQRMAGAYSFSALERSVDVEDLDCPEVLTGIMLREPLAAMKSTLVGNGFEKSSIFEALRSRVVPKNQQFHFCLPPTDSFQHFDNFAVRSLGGAYEKGIGEVNEEDLERAKGQNLSKIRASSEKMLEDA